MKTELVNKLPYDVSDCLLAENKALRRALEKSVQYIEQLANTANTISIHAGLGPKVRADDFTEHALTALAKVSK